MDSSISYQGQLSNVHAPLRSNVRHTVVDVDEFIINEVHRRPHLYDMKHNDYRDLVKRRNSFTEIGKMLQMSGNDVQCQWRGLRDRFTKEKKTIEDRIHSGAQLTEIRYSKYYHAMTFIADYICIRRSTSNLDSEADDPNNSPNGESQPSMALEDLSQAYSEILDASPDPSLEPVNDSFSESEQDQRPFPAFSPDICATSRSSNRSTVPRPSPSPARSVKMPRLPGPPPKRRRENSNNNETSLAHAITSFGRQFTNAMQRPSDELDGWARFIASMVRKLPEEMHLDATLRVHEVINNLHKEWRQRISE